MKKYIFRALFALILAGFIMPGCVPPHHGHPPAPPGHQDDHHDNH